MASYVTYAEFIDQELPADALANVPQATVEKAITYASSKANSYLRKRYTLPLVMWKEDLREAVCSITAWRLMRRRGFKPASGANEAIVKAYDDAVGWLKEIAAGEAELDGAEDSTSDLDEAGTLSASEDFVDFHFFTSDGDCESG